MTNPEHETEAAGLAERIQHGTQQRLEALSDLSVADHVTVFDALHRELAQVLDSLDRDSDSSDGHRQEGEA